MSMCSASVCQLFFYKMIGDPRIESHEDLLKEYYLDYSLKRKKEYPNFIIEVSYKSWGSCQYDEDFYAINNFRDKMELAYASLFEDTKLDNIIKKYIPEVEKIEKPKYRNGFELQKALDEYNVSLEDFLLDKRYFVVLDNNNQWVEMLCSGVINTELFDCSYDDLFKSYTNYY